MKKLFKKKSKRMPANRRYKIQKKVREHQRKVKKEARKNKDRNKSTKDPGVPNSCPFKEKILNEAEQSKRTAEEQKIKRREELKELRKKQREERLAKERGLSLESLVERAESQAVQHDAIATATQTSDGNKASSIVTSSTKAYYKEFRRVLEAADVVLEVLDARDPLGSRSKLLEETVLSCGTAKRLILVLNKADLVPKENLQRWLKYLRREFPTIAFKASVSEGSDTFIRKRKNPELASEGLRQSSVCLGADSLMQLLGNYTRNKGLKTSIVVGVVGYPNVGKSSVINSLKHSKACSVGAIPGVTKSMQMVQLDKHIQLLDSPGMVLASSDGLDPCQVALKNAIRVESLPDPISPVEGLIQRASKKQLMLQYRLPDFKTTEEFLQVLAKRFGYLKKGGIPDVDKSARQILKHWNSGRIKYYTEPPEAPLVHVSAEIVKEMANEFRLEDLMETEDKIFTALPVVPTMDTMEIQPLVTETQHTASSLNCESKSAEEEEEDDGNDQEGKGEEREESYSKAVTRSLTSTAHEEKLLEKIKKKVERERARKKFLDPLEPGNQRLNMVRRVHMKKLARKAKKDKKRTERAAVQLADTLADTL